MELMYYPPLTARELDVLVWMQSWLSWTEIADELYVSKNTVKTHARAIYTKLGAASRREAVERAHELGLMRAESDGSSNRVEHPPGEDTVAASTG